MDINNSSNQSQSDTARVEIHDETECVGFKRELPPPYSSEITRVTTVTNTPITHQPVITHQSEFKNKPTFTNCPQCGVRVLTRVEYLNSRKTHLFAGFICGFTLWCLLCCLAAIPYLVKTCKKTHHHCPNCNLFLGAYSLV